MAERPARPARRPSNEDGALRSAFRELHGARLHGFALLVTLGDRRLAERLASEALADGARRARALRHPERAAAWLRAHLLRHLGRDRAPAPTDEERRGALATLGVDAAAYDTLSQFDPRQRATLVAGWIEALDPRDLEGVVQYRPAVLARMLARVRREYLALYIAAAPTPIPIVADPQAIGPLARRIRSVADRTLPGSGSTR